MIIRCRRFMRESTTGMVMPEMAATMAVMATD
jgi:hypothetical protein